MDEDTTIDVAMNQDGMLSLNTKRKIDNDSSTYVSADVVFNWPQVTDSSDEFGDGNEDGGLMVAVSRSRTFFASQQATCTRTAPLLLFLCDGIPGPFFAYRIHLVRFNYLPEPRCSKMHGQVETRPLYRRQFGA